MGKLGMALVLLGGFALRAQANTVQLQLEIQKVECTQGKSDCLELLSTSTPNTVVSLIDDPKVSGRMVGAAVVKDKKGTASANIALTAWNEADGTLGTYTLRATLNNQPGPAGNLEVTFDAPEKLNLLTLRGALTQDAAGKHSYVLLRIGPASALPPTETLTPEENERLIEQLRRQSPKK